LGIMIKDAYHKKKEEYDEECIQYVKKKVEVFTVFPLLFVSLLSMLHAYKMNKEIITKYQNALFGCNGLKMLGIIQKVLYGRMYKAIEYFQEVKLSPTFGFLSSLHTRIHQKAPILLFPEIEKLERSEISVENWIELWKETNSKILDNENQNSETENLLVLLEEELKNQICWLRSVGEKVTRSLLTEYTTQILESQLNVNNNSIYEILDCLKSSQKKLIQKQQEISNINKLSDKTVDIGLQMMQSNLIFPNTILLEKPIYCIRDCKYRGRDIGEMIECKMCKCWYHFGVKGCVSVENASEWVCEECKENLNMNSKKKKPLDPQD